MGYPISRTVSTHAKITSRVNDQKRVLLLVLYSGTRRDLILLLIVSSIVGNYASSAFGHAPYVNHGDCLGVPPLV